MSLSKWSAYANRSDLSGSEIAEILRVVAMALLTAIASNEDIQRLYRKAVQRVEELL